MVVARLIVSAVLAQVGVAVQYTKSVLNVAAQEHSVIRFTDLRFILVPNAVGQVAF
jgi:hypothetical protein